ncbi:MULTISPECIES: acyl carrier protein phosphodiesterase [unclassified Flavobacterium]|jgi:acyl carrier protein phosphodiesterase|uniref:acyl carrier protein phosphodiesterase n=1 Tax=unclassified Flavobacterium TaxID=196869 RepID=UPI0025C105B7|nr:MULTISPECIES: acyl carrier protein phosphodiesterase [unclassified Flavobacterium]
MNFLAHIYLSGDNDLMKIGNFMADGIHGKHFGNFPMEIQKGIILHRNIDTFTDAHPVFRLSTKRLHANYHHYSGVIVDVFYDHFLAKNWSTYSDEKLEDYVERFYQSLKDNYNVLTPRTQNLMPYMIEHNWLVSYQTIEGIERILAKMDTRMKYESNMRFSVAELKTSYSEFEEEFTTFFENLITFTQDKILSE